MDILLGSFVKKYLGTFNIIELKYLEQILLIEDEILYEWYYSKKKNHQLSINKVSELFNLLKPTRRDPD